MNRKVLTLLAVQNPDNVVLIQAVEKILAHYEAQAMVKNASIDALRREVLALKGMKRGKDGISPVLPNIQAMVDASIDKIKVPVIEAPPQIVKEVETIREIVKEVPQEIEIIEEDTEIEDVVGLEDELQKIRDEIRDRTKGGGGATYGGVADMIAEFVPIDVPVVGNSVTLPKRSTGKTFEVHDDLGTAESTPITINLSDGDVAQGLPTPLTISENFGWLGFKPNPKVPNAWRIYG